MEKKLEKDRAVLDFIRRHRSDPDRHHPLDCEDATPHDTCPICRCPIERNEHGFPNTAYYLRVGGFARYVCSQECEDFFYENGHEADECPHKDGLDRATERLDE